MILVTTLIDHHTRSHRGTGEVLVNMSWHSST